MDYRIIFFGIVILFAALHIAYRDSGEGIYYEVSGKLLHKEKKVEIIQRTRSKTTQFNIYLFLEGHESPFIYREFEKYLAERYWPSFTLGDNLALYVHRDHGLVWGMSRNGILVLDPKVKQKKEVSGSLWLSALGFTFLVIGTLWKRIREFFSLGYKYR